MKNRLDESFCIRDKNEIDIDKITVGESGQIELKEKKMSEKNITEIGQIDTSMIEGKLLLAAMAKITTESQTDKTPDEVLQQLNDLVEKMFREDIWGRKMKVYKIMDGKHDPIDWIAAWNIQEALDYYKYEYGVDADDYTLEDLKEVDIKKEGMWYGFSYPQFLAWLEGYLQMQELRIRNSGMGDYDVSVWLTFEEVLKIDNRKEPYIICSTEV